MHCQRINADLYVCVSAIFCLRALTCTLNNLRKCAIKSGCSKHSLIEGACKSSLNFSRVLLVAVWVCAFPTGILEDTWFLFGANRWPFCQWAKYWASLILMLTSALYLVYTSDICTRLNNSGVSGERHSNRSVLGSGNRCAYRTLTTSRPINAAMLPMLFVYSNSWDFVPSRGHCHGRIFHYAEFDLCLLYTPRADTIFLYCYRVRAQIYAVFI